MQVELYTNYSCQEIQAGLADLNPYGFFLLWYIIHVDTSCCSFKNPSETPSRTNVKPLRKKDKIKRPLCYLQGVH